MINGILETIDSREPVMTTGPQCDSLIPWPKGRTPVFDGVPSRGRSVHPDEYGWPFKSLASAYAFSDEGMVTLEVIYGIEIPSFFGRKYKPGLEAWHVKYALPFVPRVGLVLNALTYFLVGCAIVWVAGTLRRKRRRRAGRCETCGYPRPSEVPVCPECGLVFELEVAKTN